MRRNDVTAMLTLSGESNLLYFSVVIHTVVKKTCRNSRRGSMCLCMFGGGMGEGKCDGLASFAKNAPGFSMICKLSSAQVNDIVYCMSLLTLFLIVVMIVTILWPNTWRYMGTSSRLDVICFREICLHCSTWELEICVCYPHWSFVTRRNLFRSTSRHFICILAVSIKRRRRMFKLLHMEHVSPL